MANEVVNPYQTYRDRKGVPLAGGTLRILQPGTSSLGTAFSDSALTIAQIVDGYPLDAFGRVTGDLRWSGLRDVESYNANGAFNRLDDDVTTLFDASVFTILEPSVAAMIANTTLVVGDTVETLAYNLDQKEGGARYSIVAGGTGTEDGYIFHDLDNALQAELIDQERHNNFYVAGAIGDGLVDDTVPCQRALNIGGDIECANGIFAAAQLTLSVNARIYGNGTLLRLGFSNADLITLSGEDIVITFDGLLLDGNLTNQSDTQAIALVRSSITASAATTISLITFNNVQFQNGSENDLAAVGDDSGFPVLYTFSQCDFLGGEEGEADGSYLPASIDVSDGVFCSIEDCYWSIQTSPTVGRGAVYYSAASATNEGWLSVTASTFNLMGLEATALSDSRPAIYAFNINNFIATDNRLLGPLAGGIAWDGCIDSVTVAKNVIEAHTIATLGFGAIASTATPGAEGGTNWLIDDNQVINSEGVAIDIDGESDGTDASNVQISNNLIVAPAAGGILYQNVINLSMLSNYINMDGVAAFNAIQCDTGGVSGTTRVEANQIVNLALTAAIVDLNSTEGIYIVDGNTIDDAGNGVMLDGMGSVFLTNNVFNEVTLELITLSNLDSARIDGNSYIGTNPADFAQASNVTDLVTGENFWQEYDASITELAATGAADQTIGPVTSHYHIIAPSAGSGSIATVTDPGIDGYMVTFQTDGVAIDFNENGNMNLGGDPRELATDQDTLTLVWNETNTDWNEIAFSTN